MDPGGWSWFIVTALMLFLQTALEFSLIFELGQAVGGAKLNRVLVLGLLLSRLCLGAITPWTSASLAGHVRGTVQTKLWRGTVTQSGYAVVQRGAALHNRALTTAPTDAALGMAVPLAQTVADVLSLTGAALVISIVRPVQAIAVLGVLIVLAGAAGRSISHGNGPASRREAGALEEAHHLSWDVTQGVRDIIINRASEFVRLRAQSAGAALADATRGYQLWASGQRSTLDSVALCLLTATGLYARSGSTAFVGAIALLRIVPLVSRVGANATQIKNASARMSNWSAALGLLNPNVSMNSKIHAGPECPADGVLPGCLVAVDLPVVPANATRLVGEVSFALSAGDWLQLRGPSGCGKSSVLDAVAGLWNDYDGSVYLRQSATLGYGSQSPFLLGGTIADNVLLGRQVSDEWFETLLTLCGLDQPGLDKQTRLLDRGANISGGQRQRISIARALIDRPDVLLLDEATANLDVASETALFEGIRSLCASMAVVVVTHRNLSLGWDLPAIALCP